MRTSFLLRHGAGATTGLLCLALTACSLNLETIARTDGSRDAASGEGSVRDGALDAPDDRLSDARDAADSDDADGCVPVPERCNGLDDDCNGAVDDGIADVTCGVGPCLRTTAGCVAGAVPVCTPGAPGVEACNSVDDDCNGAVDDGIAPVSCGVGACLQTVPGCAAGAIPPCVSGAPTAETCNGIDDDCDGTVDDGFADITCGIGACAVTVGGCVAGGVPSCTPGTAVTETCNGIDDDCDGTVDDNVVPTACGVGACGRTSTCASGAVSCTAGTAQPELCNNIDDDCDGLVDDGIPGATCGFGACRTVLRTGCTAGVPTTCTPALGTTEICDGIDNNCDGRVDENCPCDRYVVHGIMGNGLSPTTPAPTISVAIMSVPAGTTARVCVAANADASSLCLAANYPEAVMMREGVSVFGGYDPTAWTRGNPACTTTITATTALGVYFTHGMTNATQIDGFTILGAGNLAGATTSAAVTIQEGATVTNNIITGAASPTSIGVNLVAPSAVAARPLIALNTIRGGTGTLVINSIGIRSSLLAGEIRANTVIAGGAATGVSIGIELLNSPGTVIVDNPSITSGTAPATEAIHAIGDLTGVLITRNSIVSGAPLVGSTIPARGVFFEMCTAGVGTIFANANISGGTAATPAIGVDIINCRASVDSNAQIIGKTTGGSEATGVRCGGTMAVCNIQRNLRLVGFGGSGAGVTGRGVYVASGALATVKDNRGIASCTGPGSTTCQGLMIDAAATGTVVDGNLVDIQRGTWAVGILTRGTISTVSNNLVFANASTGILIDPRAGPSFEPVVHSNTVVGPAMPGGSALAATNLIVTDNEGISTPPVGVFRNNNAVCLGATTNRFAFAEYGGFADPRVFENNNLWGCDTLYRNSDGATPATMLLTSLATINTLADVPVDGNNISFDPLFVSATDWHLQPTSPLIDAGTASGAPFFDFEGQLRPARPRFDIGCDEVAP